MGFHFIGDIIIFSSIDTSFALDQNKRQPLDRLIQDLMLSLVEVIEEELSTLQKYWRNNA